MLRHHSANLAALDTPDVFLVREFALVSRYPWCFLKHHVCTAIDKISLYIALHTSDHWVQFFKLGHYPCLSLALNYAEPALTTENEWLNIDVGVRMEKLRSSRAPCDQQITIKAVGPYDQHHQ